MDSMAQLGKHSYGCGHPHINHLFLIHSSTMYARRTHDGADSCAGICARGTHSDGCGRPHINHHPHPFHHHVHPQDPGWCVDLLTAVLDSVPEASSRPMAVVSGASTTKQRSTPSATHSTKNKKGLMASSKPSKVGASAGTSVGTLQDLIQNNDNWRYNRSQWTCPRTHTTSGYTVCHIWMCPQAFTCTHTH